MDKLDFRVEVLLYKIMSSKSYADSLHLLLNRYVVLKISTVKPSEQIKSMLPDSRAGKINDIAKKIEDNKEHIALHEKELVLVMADIAHRNNSNF